jgi:hypothetical protein
MKRRKERLSKHFDPEKYKMIFCPYCRGTGKSPDGDKARVYSDAIKTIFGNPPKEIILFFLHLMEPVLVK